MVTEARRPPVFQETRREAITAIAVFEITIMNQNFDRVGDASGRIVHQLRVQPFESLSRAWREHAVNRRFGEDFHGDGETLILQAPL